ncbi:DUF2989 domain-containing protein [Vibrio viridaestus]|uniref:DUF2989 domain-containing protein n=1 Tax=Vibrio viridaestus TaxID=2487322 RepID=A0A3N9TG97_9VIBR|nr:DUF2989 domain-containing protein [Vibrio viridaestus]RQW63179.1 DUF2989 domain-containing protein [Vibrio viridaestus]
MTKLKLTVLAVCICSLTGCFENTRNTDELCANNPQLKCDELNINDGQCRIPRTNLIWHRYEVSKDATDANKIQEYTLTQEYLKCLEVAAQIQPIEQAKLKQQRFNALVNAGDSLKRLEKELHNYNTPKSLYFLWSQTGDTEARRSFLQLEGKKELDTPDMQYALATFYIDRDRQKTVGLLNRSIELTKSPENINVSALESLASVYKLLRQREKSYIWAMTSKAFGAPIVSDKELSLLYGFDEEKKEKLDTIANTVIDAINDGDYRSSLIPETFN